MHWFSQRLVYNQFEESFLPYLERGPIVENDAMWFVGKDGKGFPVFKFYVCSLLQNLDRDNSVIVPDAPLEVLEQLGELLHTG